jgi:predicted MFS family arabinose efflux permease
VLATIVASRFALNAVFRVTYPLVPFIALSYSVTAEQATWIVTIQVLCGLASPLGGWLGDRLGYRRTMALGAALVLLGAFGAALAPSLPLLIVAFGLCGLGISVYQPPMQAYVSALTPYHLRGRAVGLVELSWALAGILAVPSLMWLVERQESIVGAFTLLGVCLTLVTLATLFILPNPPAQPRDDATNAGGPGAVLRNPNVLGMLGFVFLTLGGLEMLFIVQSPWAAERFNASLVDLGLAAFVFGLGEIGGSLGSTLLTDRLGKRRAATIGFGLAAIVYLLLPLLSVSWPVYLICFFFFALFAEFGIVAALTFASTVSLVSRATVMALTVMAIQVSRAISSRIGVPLWEATSLSVNGVVAALLTLVGIAVALRYAHEAERHAPLVERS